MTLQVLDLFSGIGGFSLGLERAGMKTVAFCEIEKFPRRVLAKHWPEVPIYDDVRTLTANRLASDGISVDLICGGFPCTDISVAGKGLGITGPQSGLWREYARLIGELRPRYVIVENVAALLGRGLGDVLGDLAALGYDAEWHCIPASAVGAPHRRDRVWIIANSRGQQHQGAGHANGWAPAEGFLETVTPRSETVRRNCGRILEPTALADLSRYMAHAYGQRRGQIGRHAAGCSTPDGAGPGNWIGNAGQAMADANRGGQLQSGWCIPDQRGWISNGSWWIVEPDVGRVAHGVPKRVDRLRGLGNAVVPQIPELIGRAILAAEAMA